jgi:hypothetical protein
MTIEQLGTLAFWNGLVRPHSAELVLILTAGVVALASRYVWRIVTSWTSSFNRVTRFLTFLAACAVGYGALALGVSFALREGLAFHGGQYAAPAVLGLLVLMAIEAQRQKQA